MTLPIITIVGRPNVGKSTLFNALTGSRSALVADVSGVTRDRQYGKGEIDSRSFIVVDTGGLEGEDDHPLISGLTESQVMQAISESDCLLFLVDAKSGLLPDDEIIAKRLRKSGKKVVLAVNKADQSNKEIVRNEFYSLGFGEPHLISAKRKHGLKSLLQDVLSKCPAGALISEESTGIKIAVIGRPNVGKSTLVNRILGENRMIVSDLPGTTRDSVSVVFMRDNKKYTLIDTAGVRRKSRIHEVLEKFSVIKSLQAIHEADVVFLVMDATEGVTDQDLRLIQLVVSVGSGLVIAFNKWDSATAYQRKRFKDVIERKMQFVNFARHYCISALKGTGLKKLFTAAEEAYRSSQREFSTSELTQILEQAVKDHEPPLVKGRRIRLRYAHMGGQCPMTVVVHGKQTESLPRSYQLYLAHYFRKALHLVGATLHVKFKTDPNPYQKIPI